MAGDLMIDPAPTRRLGEYIIAQVLAADRTYIATDSSGRKVVLKSLPPDCLLRGRLHPEIRDRLGRVRELAQTALAHLYGVERDREKIFAVWQFVPGVPFDEFVNNATKDEFGRLAVQLCGAVESMHALGIVHGQLSSGNVLVDRSGFLRITHVSPLLHEDKTTDLLAVFKILKEASSPWPEHSLLFELPGGTISLSNLRMRLSSPTVNQTVSNSSHDEKGLRWRILAAIAAILALSIAAGLYLGKTWTSGDTTSTPPRIHLQPPEFHP